MLHLLWAKVEESTSKHLFRVWRASTVVGIPARCRGNSASCGQRARAAPSHSSLAAPAVLPLCCLCLSPLSCFRESPSSQGR